MIYSNKMVDFRYDSYLKEPHQWQPVTLKTGRWEVPGSNPGRACRPSRSEFSVVFSETSINVG